MSSGTALRDREKHREIGVTCVARPVRRSSNAGVGRGGCCARGATATCACKPAAGQAASKHLETLATAA